MSKSTVRTPTIEFSRGPAGEADGDVVRVKGVIFRAGTYPEKAFAITPDELRERVATFIPVPVDLGHPSSASPLDGQFGNLESVELSDDGTTMSGTVALQKWLKDKLGDARLRVSASWDRATKRLRSVSLVTHPHIPDAELQAAFACACGHDDAKAATSAKETPMTRKEQALARLAEMDDESVFDAILDDNDTPDDDLGDDPDEDFEDERPDLGASNFSNDEAVMLRAEVEELKAERRRERAAAFAKDLKAQGRIAPFEEPCAVAVMFSAMSDDAIAGDTVDFAVGDTVKRGTREQMIRTAYGQRMPHGKTREYLAGSGSGSDAADFSRVLDNGGDPPETDAEYAKRLVAKYNGRNKIAK